MLPLSDLSFHDFWKVNFLYYHDIFLACKDFLNESNQPQPLKYDASCLPHICNSQQNYRLNANTKYNIKSNQAALKINQLFKMYKNKRLLTYTSICPGSCCMTEKVTLSLIGHPSSIAAYYNKKKIVFNLRKWDSNNNDPLFSGPILRNLDLNTRLIVLKTYKVPTIYFWQ